MAKRNIEVGLRLTADLRGLDQLDNRWQQSMASLERMTNSLARETAGLADQVAEAFDALSDQALDKLDQLGDSASESLGDLARELPQSLGSVLDSLNFDLADTLGQGLAGLLGGGPEGLLDRLVKGLGGDIGSLLQSGVKELGGLLGDVLGGGLGGEIVSSLVSELGGGLVSRVLDMGTRLLGDLFGGQAMTPEEAEARIEAAVASLEGMFAVMRQGQGSVQELQGTLAPMAAELMRLGRIAGLSEQDIAAMITRLDPELGQAFLKLAAPSGQAAAALQEFAANTRNFTNISDEAEAQLVRWARAVGMSEDQVRRLVSRLRQGEMSAQQFADAFSGGVHVFEPFANGLDHMTNSLNGFNQSLGQTGRQMADIKQYSVSGMQYQGVDGSGGAVAYRHGGGGVARYAHGGLLVPRLYPDEVPIIARAGEFVVRAESVNPASLPWLRALNQGSQPAAAPAGGGVSFSGPLVEIHGNFLGGDEAAEDLARLVEGKLRELASGRFG